MVNPKELMKGNIIGWRTGFGDLITGPIYEVHKDKVAIGPETIIDNNSSGQGFIKATGIEPVPLTAAWVKKLGLQFNYGYEFASVFNLYIEYGEPCCHVCLEQYSEGRELLPNIKYVHQFQVLFAALIGKELKVIQ